MMWLLACQDPQEEDETSQPVDTSEPLPSCLDAAATDVRLAFATYAWQPPDPENAPRPGQVVTWIAPTEDVLLDRLYAEAYYEGDAASLDWETEVALVGYLDANAGLPSAFTLTRLDGLGTETLATEWCVAWPDYWADSSSRTVRVYATPRGEYQLTEPVLVEWAE